MTKNLTLQSLGTVKKNFKAFHFLFWRQLAAYSFNNFVFLKHLKWLGQKNDATFLGVSQTLGSQKNLQPPNKDTPTLVGNPQFAWIKIPPILRLRSSKKAKPQLCQICGLSVWCKRSKKLKQHLQNPMASQLGAILPSPMKWNEVWIVLLGGEATIEKHSHCLCVFCFSLKHVHFASEKSSHFSRENKLTNLGQVISTLVKIPGLVSKSCASFNVAHCWSPSVSWEIANMEANGNALPVIRLGNIEVVTEHQRKIDRTFLVKKAWQRWRMHRDSRSLFGVRMKTSESLVPFFGGHQEVECRAGRASETVSKLFVLSWNCNV